MLNWKSICVLLTLSLGHMHCQRGANDGTSGDSRLSSVSIGDFRPNPALNLPAWSKMQLLMNRIAPSPQQIDRSYPRSEGMEVKDSQVQVPYGTYKMNLSYWDAQGKLVYESCAADKLKEHAIQQPQYKATVMICMAGTQETVGSSVSDIEIIPVFEPSQSPGPLAELSACAAFFPKASPSANRPYSFENEKGSAFFVSNMASLAPCLLLADRCNDSVRWVQSLSGAVGSITQNIRNASGGDQATFLKNLSTDSGLASSIGEHAACIKQQPRGVQGFVDDYVAIVKTLL